MALDHVGTIKITSISLRSGGCSCEYILRVFTKDRINGVQQKAILKGWGDSICCRKRRIAVQNNEIRIHLKKGDTIQKYIDCISEIIKKIRYYINSSSHIKLKGRMKNVKLKRGISHKVYCLAGKKNYKKAL